ncbi:alkyldihydroxyacetonephosphate synthase [Austwickia chelonae]|uniref:Putative FAD-linked oxidase n=1 Tax=Austwickia chelonae NBRC 105200 TaxID=1184607 RepID=K6VUC8_9MICO|nr:FAD-binding oxidoreductase [Austwickia chelonae]GAB78950.1 putative FAD-linked oxidase [Austwickia chelonae NBRC 105200]SEV87146.1 alkyldihydroxyacetonephosphate synthase [Austwickia chelonae]
MVDALTRSVPRSVWHGWGDPTQVRPLAPAAWTFLGERLGAEPQAVPRKPVTIGEVRLPERQLPEQARLELIEIVGGDHVREDRDSRVCHAGGKSWPDLFRAWTGDGSAAPDAVILPRDEEQVGAVLQVCADHRIAVVPFGGGTSVVGGVQSDLTGPDTDPDELFTGVIALDLRRLDRMLSYDPISRTAVFQAGLRGPDVEQALRPHGMTFGHYPQSHQEATFGGYLATRSAGQASTGYGRPDEHVLGLTMVTPTGTLNLGGRSPASAAGPRLQDLVLGSEGTLGIITEASVRVHPMPTVKRHATWVFESYQAGCDALRALAQDLGEGIIADVCRLSDEEETEVNLKHAGRAGQALLRYCSLRGMEHPALLILVWEGTDSSLVKARQSACEGVLRKTGGRSVPSVVAKAWEKHRFSGPYTRDYLLAHRVLADTLETATTWDRLPALHSAVGGAIRHALEQDGRRCLVMCHVSHVYAAGASLYYTFVCPENDDPMGQWQAVKQAACQAIVTTGGTITHHHAVGRDHRPYVGAEWGQIGVRAVRAIKQELDPVGILNPGKLIPDEAKDVT